MPLNLAIMEDYPIVVEGLRALLVPYSDRVRVIEVDLGLPLVGGVDLVLYDTFANPFGHGDDPRTALGITDAKLVAFAWDLDPSGVLAALRGGIDGFICKSFSGEELVSALERIHRGERVAPDDLAGPDLEVLLGQWPGVEHGLSGRESEVLALICQGLSNAEISEEAYIGVNTVKTYIRSAYRKIEVTTRAQAVIWGLSNGFTPEPQRI